jgi:hypothetical protein
MKNTEIKEIKNSLSRRFANVRRSRDGQWSATDHTKGSVKGRKVRILLGDDAAAKDGSMQYSR